MDEISVKLPPHEETGLERRQVFRGIQVNAAGKVSIQFLEQFLDKNGEVFKEGSAKNIGVTHVPPGPGVPVEQDADLTALGEQILATVKKYADKHLK